MSLAEPLHVRCVLILKSDHLYAEVLRQYTLKVFPKTRVRLATTLAAAECALAAEPVDLLITGAAASLDGDVLDFLARDLPQAQRTPRVLVVTARHEYRVLSALRTIGAHGVFDSAAEPPEQFMEALRAIAAGRRYWSATIVDQLQRNKSAAHALFRVLTAFEQIVLSLIGDGSDDALAARELGLSPATIATVRRELHRKLGVQHRGELVRIAAQHGFIRFTSAGVVRPGFALLSAAYHARRNKRGPAELPLSTAELALPGRVPLPASRDRLLAAVA